jgi:septum formation topological specificity factor MinE
MTAPAGLLEHNALSALERLKGAVWRREPIDPQALYQMQNEIFEIIEMRRGYEAEK